VRRFILAIIFCSCFGASGLCTSKAETLQGSIEQSDSVGMQGAADSTTCIPLQGSVDQSLYREPARQESLVNPSDFSPVAQQPQYVPQPRRSIPAETTGGQDEYSVNWDAWRHRIADAVWAPIGAQGIWMWGQTRVLYDVTRDHHIEIISVRSPDPTGKSGRILAASVMRLEGNPILEFPAGSRQTIHRNENKAMGLPQPERSGGMIYLPGGTEHVGTQW
jgi:hypothetical protein